jgi:deazaflavin-dependent oxidoreductase (nitroreductase family)
VAADILQPRAAASVAEESRKGLGAAALERAAEHVSLLHLRSIEDRVADALVFSGRRLAAAPMMVAAFFATIQIKSERIGVRAETARGDERARLWRRMTEVWPDYDRYRQRTDREIPVVVFRRR